MDVLNSLATQGAHLTLQVQIKQLAYVHHQRVQCQVQNPLVPMGHVQYVGNYNQQQYNPY